MEERQAGRGHRGGRPHHRPHHHPAGHRSHPHQRPRASSSPSHPKAINTHVMYI